jgi:hypothetical protein
MAALHLPPDVEGVLREFYTAEFTTVNTKGQPMTWPSVIYYDEGAGQFVGAVSVSFPIKAYNARKHPQVSLLFSDPTGSKLTDPPAVLVQGDAAVSEVLEYGPQIIGVFKTVAKRQPESGRFTSNRFIRQAFVWYLFQRIALVVTPRRILVWPHRDFSAAPTVIEVGREVSYVE